MFPAIRVLPVIAKLLFVEYKLYIKHAAKWHCQGTVYYNYGNLEKALINSFWLGLYKNQWKVLYWLSWELSVDFPPDTCLHSSLKIWTVSSKPTICSLWFFCKSMGSFYSLFAFSLKRVCENLHNFNWKLFSPHVYNNNAAVT